MKKKLLGFILALSVGLGCIGALFACSNGDAKVAESAIGTIKEMYENEALETPEDYTVVGQVKGSDDKTYPITWTTNSTNAVPGEMDSSSKLVTVAITRGSEDINYSLKASVTVGSTTKSVSFDHVIPAAIEGADLVYDFSSLTGTGSAIGSDALLAHMNGLTTTDELTSITVSSVYAGNGEGGAYPNQGGFLKMGTSNNNGVLTLNFKKQVNKVVVEGQSWTSSSNDTISVNGAEEVDLSKDGKKDITFEIDSTNTVTITTAKRAFIFKIMVYYTPGVHNHEWSYTHLADSWTHTKSCIASGCDLSAEEATVNEQCTPLNNVCRFCDHEYSETDILTAFLALEKDKSLPGSYSLTGVVTEITGEFSSQYNNITFKMKVGNFDEFTAYRVVGTGIDTIKVGDTVTISGELMNYNNTFEFGQGSTVTNIVPGEDTRDDAAKIADALKKVSETMTISAVGDTTLPVPTVDGVSFAWSLESGDAATLIDSNTKLHVEALPAQTATVTLKVVATCGEVTTEGSNNVKTVTVTIMGANINYGTIEQPLTVAEALELASTLGSGEWTAQPVYMKGVLTNVPTDKTTFWQTLYLADADKLSTTILVYSINLREASIAAPVQNDILTICGYITNYNGNTIEFSTYKPDNNTSIYVYIEKNDRGESTITVENEGGATVSNLPEKATNGSKVEFQVTPADGKKIVSVKAGSETLTEADGKYEFTMNGNMTVTIESEDASAKTSVKIAEMVFNKTATYDKYVAGYQSSFTATSGNYSWTVSNINNNDKAENAWDHVRAGRKNNASTGTIDTTNALAAIITKAEIVISATGTGALNIKFYVSNSSTFTEEDLVGTKSITKDTITFNIPTDKQGKDLYYRFAIECDASNTSSNGYVHIDSVAYYGYEDDEDAGAVASAVEYAILDDKRN